MNHAKPTLHFICGKIASGKTTLALDLARATGAVFICEDEWMSKLFGPELKTFENYITYSNRLKVLLSGHVETLLRQGVSVIFDFAGNTPNHRKWVRSVFESAGADHRLYVLDLPDEECKKRLASRNLDKPVGLYWGTSPTESDFDLITTYFSIPTPEEGFHVVHP